MEGDRRRIITAPSPAVTAFWAKLTQVESGTRLHPLLCHLLDVAMVARALWTTWVPSPTQDRIGAVLGVSEQDAPAWIAFLAGSHDLGKASPDFQLRRTTDSAVLRRLHAAGLTIAPALRASGRRTAHGTITASALRPLLREEFDVSDEVAERVGIAVGGHHGVFPRRGDIQAARKSAGKGPWVAARRELTIMLANQLLVPSAAPPLRIDTPTALWLAGLVTVADWLGSDEQGFPYLWTGETEPEPIDVASYAARADQQAHGLLAARGWRALPTPTEPRPFAVLFPNLEPNALQQAVENLAARLSGPALMMIEAPMGEGKTEAALTFVDRQGVSGRAGAYVALPTQATSNQMFERLKAFLEQRYDADVVNLQLLHGHAALSAEFAALPANIDFLARPSGVHGEQGYDAAPAGVIAAEWFTYRKRGLLAPFGVGTIDQALLAVLRTRHGFVRLFGLADKTIVLDEVHAYDAYMSTLLTRLLTWLGALGASVVVLSATLPSERRGRLVAAYAEGLGRPAPALPPTPYPRLTWLSAETAGAITTAASTRGQKTVVVTLIDGRLPITAGDRFPLGEHLQEAVREGGCAAVICNTVGRAQQVYTALGSLFKGTAADGAPRLDLLHARYLFHERERRQQRALRRFGKHGAIVDGEVVRRPTGAILVATQVIEQSLDLDFDLMVTDMAPVDLVLQRLGRLHRHALPRPPGLRQPSLWLCRPDREDDGVATFDTGTAVVYDDHILLRSWLALRTRTTIQVPDDIPGLVEAVYDGEAMPPSDASATLRNHWEATWQQMMIERDDDDASARQNALLPPSANEEIFADRNLELEEENQAIHHTLQALTRLGDQSLNVICLPPAEREELRRSAVPTVDQAKALLRFAVPLSHRGLVSILAQEPMPSGWQRSPLLRHHRLVALDENNARVVGKWRLRVDAELGVVIDRPD